ncbi:hypothetical protein PFICI_00777 [Pestalotiopsis fici W106-1]|uniref:Uncharacterized protein n=1 Tax=Pestalotiopsis fici (strain W106-1 / CGMCC3.15140) TaxID=1229662 RepID=W3XLS4_PESFW|nr:uncharacterized protein PFICI_00777 [Pestalotiopsis fici W106-1]ETS86949.1 hypothetical protein PFICI_00777 [Pestalotiopsis fici W106-1]
MNPLRPMNNHQFNPFEPHPELDDIDVPDDVDYVNNTDPFGIFAARGMGAPPMMQPKEVRELAARRSERIFAGYRLLQSILERHESTIQKRWEKKSRPQRLSILLGAWPDMPLTHRPDFAAFRRNSNNIPRVAAQHRSAFLWPSINQEDLGDPRTLPLLLNARGRNHPHVFAAADGEQSHLGKVTMAIVPVFLNEHVILINGMPEQKDYGKLLAWSEHEDAFDWMHERKQFLPGEGLLILEFQERLLGFLVECCQKILHDIPADRVAGDEYPIQPEPSLKEGVDATGFSTLGVLAREAAYRPPAKLDLGKIESLLAARTVRAEDHIWAMREDPSYFADILLDMKEHRQEMIKDLRGGLHPTLLPPREGLLWARVIGSVLTESFFQLEIFAELRTQVQRLQVLSEKYKSEIDPGKDLPKEYLEALLKFRFYLLRAVKGVLEQLKMTTTASPPLRSLFVREVPVSVSSSMMQIMSKGVRMDETTKSLMWLLQTLWEDGNNLFLAKLTTVVDELDRLLRADPKASELVSSYIAGLVGELSIVGECLRQLEIYQPWANNFENAMVEREEEFKKEFAQRSASWAQVLECFNEKNTIGLRQLGDPTGGRFQYPIGKRRNKANVEMLRTSEANLDAFWSAVDQMLHKKVHKLSGTAYKKLLSQPRYLQRTPEWVEPTAKKDGKPSERQVEELIVPFSRLFQSSEPVTSARAEALAAGLTKTKIKSRGAPGTMPEEENTEAALPAVIDDVQPIFKIDARALKVFRIVFFDPSANTTAGEVAWRDFLHAMDSTGFTAQKLYGSVWHFQPTKLDVERSIQFHEPHPRGKIPFLVARRHGRRLNRAYGWRGSMFVLEDKKN